MILRRLSFCIFAAVFFMVACAESELCAEITLTGAQIYAAGDNTDGAFSIGNYRYTTNSADDGFSHSQVRSPLSIQETMSG